MTLLTYNAPTSNFSSHSLMSRIQYLGGFSPGFTTWVELSCVEEKLPDLLVMATCNTLVCRIDVHARLLVLRKNSPLYTFIWFTLKFGIKSSKLKTAYNPVINDSIEMSKKPNNHFFSFENQNNLHNYWFARKFPPCKFIDFPENFLSCTFDVF